MGSACFLTLSCLGFRLDTGNGWLSKEEAEKCARNFRICQLLPRLGWAMVASPRQICQERRSSGEGGEDRLRGEPGPSACLGNWRFHAKRPMVNCFKCISLPSLLSSLPQKVVNNSKPANFENAFLPRGPASF